MKSRLHLSDTAMVTQLVVKCVQLSLPPLQQLTVSNIQAALYNLGLTGIPITNVNNNCSTGSTALYQVNNLVKSGLVECGLALGFERMAPGRYALLVSRLMQFTHCTFGSLGSNFPDRSPPTLLFGKASWELESTLSAGTNFGPSAPRMFANGNFRACLIP
jgi:sterol carrier protein 2